MTVDRRRFTAGAALAAVLPLGGVVMAQTPNRFQPVIDLLARQTAAGTPPGAQVVVMENGRVVLNTAHGLATLPGVASDRPASTDTVVWIASMTKPIIVTAILMLAEEGKLSVSDPVSKFIPELAALTRVRVLKPGSASPRGAPGAALSGPPPAWDIVPAARAVTLKDILTHTAGLQQIDIPNDALPATTPEDTLATWTPKVAAMALERQPGTGWGYSNVVGFDVMARVVEVASGEPVDVFVKRRIFDPLGMKDTGWGAMYDARAPRTNATGPSTRPAVRDGRVLKSGAAGLWASLEDYARFYQMLANGGELGGKRLLKPESVAALRTNQIGDIYEKSNPQQNKGMGFGYAVEIALVDGTSAGVPAGSYGWNGAGGTKAWVIPAQNRVVVAWIAHGPTLAEAMKLIVATPPA